MSLEMLSTIAAFFTAAVIGVTAIAALVQLRHIRASNEVSAFSESWELWYSPALQEGFKFIQRDLKRKMDDPDFRRELNTAGPVDHFAHPELNVCDFIDNIGVMVTLGLLREEIIMHPGSQLITSLWAALSPTVAIMRRKRGSQLYVSFEYLADRGRRWNQLYPNGYQPKGWRRVPTPDIWQTADVTGGEERASLP